MIFFKNSCLSLCLESFFRVFKSTAFLFLLLIGASFQAHSAKLIKIKNNPSEEGKALFLDVFIPFCANEGEENGGECKYTKTTVNFTRDGDDEAFYTVLRGKCYHFDNKEDYCGDEWVRFPDTLPAGKYTVEVLAEVSYSECRDTCQIDDPVTITESDSDTAYITVENTALPPEPILSAKRDGEYIKLTLTSKKGSTDFFNIQYCNSLDCKWSSLPGYAKKDKNKRLTSSFKIGDGRFFYGNTYKFSAYSLNKFGEWSKTHSPIVNVTLALPNQAPATPQIAELQGMLSGKVGEPVTLNITASDPDENDTLTVIAYYLNSDGVKVRQETATRPNSTQEPNKYVVNQWIPTSAGTYKYYVTASDGKATTSTIGTQGTINVAALDPPSAAITSLSSDCSTASPCYVGDNLTINYTATVPSGTIQSVDLLLNGSVVATQSSFSGSSTGNNASFQLPLSSSSAQSGHSLTVRVNGKQNDSDVSHDSNVESIHVVAKQAPANPSGLTLHQQASGYPALPQDNGVFKLTHSYQTLLQWNNSANAGRHYIECRDLVHNRPCSSANTRTTEGFWTSDSTSKLLEFKQDGLYQLRLRACAVYPDGDERCQSSASVDSTIRVKVTNRVPPSPTLTAPSESTGSYRLSWGSNRDTSDQTFELQEKQGSFDGPGEWYVYAETQNTHFDITHQPPGRYSYRLRAKNALGWSSETGVQKTVEVLPPIIRQARMASGRPNYNLELRGFNFANGAKVTLTSADNTRLRATYTVQPGEVEGGLVWSKSLSFDWYAAYHRRGIEVELINPNGSQSSYLASEASEWEGDLNISGGMTLSNDGNFLYVANGQTIKALYAQSGARVPNWHFEGLGEIVSRPIVDGTNGHLLVGTTDSRFYKVAKGNGTELWQYRTHGEIVSSAVNDSDSNTYVGDLSGHLYSFDMRDDHERLQWVYPAQSPIRETPSLSGTSIYVTTEDGQIHTIGRGLLGPDILHWNSPKNSPLAKYIGDIHWKPDPKNLPAFLRVVHLYQLLVREGLSGLPRDILTFWTFTLVQGSSLDEAAKAFLSSNQGASRGLNNLSASAFVDTLYRRAWPTGDQPALSLPEARLSRQHLISLIESGTPREHIAVYFVDALLGGQTGHNAHLLPLSNAFTSLYDSNYRDFPFECSALDGDYYRLDCDNDELPDWWEFTHFGDIKSQDGQSDADSDGQPNLMEWLADHSPCDKGCVETIVAASKQPAQKPSLDSTELKITDLSSTSAGQFRVNESGAATYNVPISLPPGVAGVTPELSLNYSSQGGNGLLGRGWSLSGLSAIRRCRQTLGQDGVAKPITWTDQDRFCLDGQRLLVTNNVPYGHAGATYATEINSFVKVTALGGTAGNPEYFKVERKDGSLSYYGKANDSRQSTSEGNTLTWSLSRFEDSVGNGIEYHYNSNNEQGHVLAEIRYAFTQVGGNHGAQGGSPLAKVVLSYTDDRPDPMGGYVAGAHFATTKRLDKIEVFSAPPTNGNDLQELRTWQLHYPEFTTGFNRVSQLERITESRGDTQLPDTVFEWVYTPLGFRGLKDRLELQPEKYSWIQDYQPADINGDGRMDLVWLNPKGESDGEVIIQHRVKYALATEDGFGTAHNVGSDRYGTIDQGDRYLHSKIATLDYNADGRSDLAYFDVGEGDTGHINPHWVIHLAKPLDDSNGDGSFEWGLSNTPIHTDISDSQTLFVDINSDGLADAVSISGYRLLERNYEATDSAQGYHFGDEASLGIQGLEGIPPTFKRVYDYSQPLESPTYYLSPNTMGDFDGDGNMDFVVYATLAEKHSKSGLALNYQYKAFIAFWEGDHLKVIPEPLIDVVQSRDDFPNQRLREHVEYRHDFIDDKVYVVDLNGDGASDLVTSSLDRETDTNHFTYRLGRGDGTFTEPNTLVSLDKDENPQFVDYNLDGSTDLVYAKNGRLLVSRWFDGQLVADAGIWSISGGSRPTLMDMTGDGRLDLLLMNKKGDAISLHLAGNDGQPLNAIHTITNGLGAKTYIRYDTLADTTHYSRRELASITENRCSWIEEERHAFGEYDDFPTRLVKHCRDIDVADEEELYSAIYGDWEFDVPADMGVNTTPQSLGKLSPVLELMAPIQVVTAVSSTAPAVNDETGEMETENVSSISYFYEQAQVQAAGRGMLGFKRLRTLDHQSNVESTTTYRQDYPFTGYPLYTEKRTEAGDVISRSVNDWQLRGWQDSWPTTAANDGVKSLGTLQPYIAKSVEEVYDLNSGALIKTVETENQAPDAFGNAGDITVTTIDELNGDSFSKKTTSKYDGGSIRFANSDHTLSSAAELGRLSYSKVTHSRPGQTSMDRESSFVYYTGVGSGGQPGQLKTETVEPNQPALRVATTYQYDAFGNQVRVSQSGRTSQQTFDAAGRYPVKTLNALGQVTEEVLARNAYGAPLKVRDINGNVAEFGYTPMGFKALEYSPSGAWTYSRRLDADSTYCPYTGMGYLMSEQTQADGGASFECFDRLGRNVRAGSKTFDGSWAVVDTEYDDIGRVKRRSEPFKLGETAEYWTEMTYDILGRVLSTDLPGITAKATASYDGFTATHTNPKGQTKTEVRNGLGELATVTDALGTTLEYEYDAQGNLTTVTTRGYDGKTVRVGMTYDLLGRKKTLDDPDKGKWSYDYNAFGELRSQTDAKGQVTEIRYDALGRQAWRENRKADGTVESRTRWTYNNDVWSLNEDNAANYGRGALLSVTDEISQYLKIMTYDALGRVSETHTSLPEYELLTNGLAAQGLASTPFAKTHRSAFGTDHYEKVTYDHLGRQHQVFDAAGDGTWSSQGIQNRYNEHGYLVRVADAHERNQAEHITYYRVKAMNLRGQVTEEAHGNGVDTVREYDPATGRLTAQNSYTADGTQIQDQSYGWDDLGNLEWRKDLGGEGRLQKNLYEGFIYDGLNRLESSIIRGVSSNVDYDSLGNITHKTGVGSYKYGSDCGRNAGPHAVCSTDNGRVQYHYDANGNLTRDSANGSVGGRALVYTTFDKPVRIYRGGHTTQFAYGPDRSRYLRTDVKGSTSKVTRYLGNVEKISHSDGRVEVKRYVGGALISLKAGSVDEMEGLTLRPVAMNSVQYLLKDHLGSMDVITNYTGTVTEAMSFDAWGARRNAFSWSAIDIAKRLNFDTKKTTTRGFTGHEMLDEVGLIHMNGRIYDARIGRFVQADIQVQFPDDTQSYNRYSYAHNNPLKYTDSSGYGLDVFDAISIIGATIIYVKTGCKPCAAAWASFWAGAKTAHYGGDFGDIAKAAFSAYVMAAYAPGTGFGAEQLFWYSVLGGITSVLQGGKFGHGFISAGVGTIAGGVTQDIGNAAGRVFVSALVAGTISEATGGKFANGAVSGAFSAAVRELSRGGEGSTNTKRLAAKQSAKGSSVTKEHVQKIWKSLKSTSEFADIEKKFGKPLSLKVVTTGGSGYQNGVVTFSLSDLKLVYATVMPDNWEDQFQHLDGDAFFDAVDAYENSYPSSFKFSVQRILFHEAYHSVDGTPSGLARKMQESFYEQKTIDKTNEFMHKYYSEPYRKDHGTVWTEK